VDDERVETDEDSGQTGDVVSPPRDDDGQLAGAVWASVGLVLCLLASFVFTLWSGVQYAFEGMTSSVHLINSVVVMGIAIGIPVAAIIGWSIRHRAFTSTGRPHRIAPLITACVCLTLGLPSIGLVASSAEYAERDAVLHSFQESLDATAVEAEGVAHLEELAATLELDVLGEPEVVRESCVLADGSAGVAPSVAIRADVGGVPAADLVRVTTAFWESKGLDVTVDGVLMASVSGEPLEDPYVDIVMMGNRFGIGPGLIYDAVCMKPAS